MNADTFMENFGHLADAPGRVKKLREMVLGLAVRGKLVPQELEDESASELLNEIEEKRELLIASGELRHLKNQQRLRSDQMPFDLPERWSWIKLGRVMEKMGAGSTPLGGKKVYVNNGIPFFRSQNIWNDGLRLKNVAYIPHEVHQSMSGTFVLPGDVLLNITGASIGRCSLVPDEFGNANVSQHVAILRLIDKRLRGFLHLCVISPFFQKTIMDVQVGVSREGLSMTRLREFSFPVPPLAEQHRIVAKVDELMSLCDELEARQRERRAVHAQLNKAALGRLTAAGTPAEFKTAWSRVRGNFDSLYSVPQTVGELRQAILQLGVQGKLVPQDSGDEPASELVRRIRAKALKLKSSGAIRRRAPLAEVAVDEALPLPSDRWAWVRFDDLADIVSGVTKGRRLEGKQTERFPYLRVANVQAGFLDLDEVKTIEIVIEELPKFQLEFGDILLTEGGDWDKLGRSAIWENQVEHCIHQNHVFRARLLDDGIRPEWIRLFTNSPVGRAYFQRASKKTTNLASINMTQLRACPIPLPPTAHQDRVLGAVEYLLTLCDELETQLTQQQADADKLTEAMVAAILAGDVPPAASRESSVVVPRRDYRDVAEIVSCYAVNRLHDRKSFHRTKHAKVLAMAQGHLGIDLGIAFERQEYGPFHSCIYDLERDAARHRWYATKEGKKNVAQYKPGRTMKEQVRRASDLLGAKLTELDRMLDLFAPLTTRQAELFATTFFAWNDLLIDGQRATETRITESFYAWHESKRKFSREKIAEAIAWLRENGMVPTGKGRKTMIPCHETKME